MANTALNGDEAICQACTIRKVGPSDHRIIGSREYRLSIVLLGNDYTATAAYRSVQQCTRPELPAARCFDMPRFSIAVYSSVHDPNCLLLVCYDMPRFSGSLKPITVVSSSVGC